MTLVISRFVERIVSVFEKNIPPKSKFKYDATFRVTHGGSDESSLRRLGKILHFSKSRSLIVKCDQAGFVKIGTKACDSKLKEIGKVQDLFGPIAAPYISIKPASPSHSKYVGRIAYALD
jgi:rRNA processing protein Gar1